MIFLFPRWATLLPWRVTTILPKEMRLNDRRRFVVVQFFLSSLQPGKAVAAATAHSEKKKWWKTVKGEAIIRFKFLMDL